MSWLQSKFSEMSGSMKTAVLSSLGLGLLSMGFFLNKLKTIFLDPRMLLFLLVAAAVVVIGIIIYKLFRRASERRRSKAVVDELADDAGMDSEFMKGITRLRENNVDLYSQPWFVVVGPPGSGKTMAIRNCGIPQVEGLEGPQQGEGGTKNMKWWFLPEAILLDTAGAVFMSESGTGPARRWQTFLDHLKRARRKASPINGVLLVVEAESLLNPERTQVREQAQKIAEQLRSLQTELGVRFPVYFLVSKCDRIVGFEEFFKFVTEQRAPEWGPDQLLGWSNPNDPTSQDVKFDGRDIREHMRGLINRLRSFRDTVLHSRAMAPGISGIPEHQRLDAGDAMYAFPDELYRLTPNLEIFLSAIFGSTSGSIRQLFLRGVYFTSARQDGILLNELLKEALGIPTSELPSMATRNGEKSFFLRELFASKMFKERGLATSLRGEVHKARSRLRTRFAAVAATTVGASLLTTIWLWQGFYREIGEETAFWVTQAREIQDSDKPEGEFELVVRNEGQWALSKTAADVITDADTHLDENELRTPWVFKPAAWIFSNPDQLRRRVTQRLVLAKVLAPAADHARNELHNGNWDRGDRDSAIASLIRLEALARGSEPQAPPAAGQVDLQAMVSTLEPQDAPEINLQTLSALTNEVLDDLDDDVRKELQGIGVVDGAEQSSDEGSRSATSTADRLENYIKKVSDSLTQFGEDPFKATIDTTQLRITRKGLDFVNVVRHLNKFDSQWGRIENILKKYKTINTREDADNLYVNLDQLVGGVPTLPENDLDSKIKSATEFAEKYGDRIDQNGLAGLTTWIGTIQAWETCLPDDADEEYEALAKLRTSLTDFKDSATNNIQSGLNNLLEAYNSGDDDKSAIGLSAYLLEVSEEGTRQYEQYASSLRQAIERLDKSRANLKAPSTSTESKRLKVLEPIAGTLGGQDTDNDFSLDPERPIEYINEVARRYETSLSVEQLLSEDEVPNNAHMVAQDVEMLARDPDGSFETQRPKLPFRIENNNLGDEGYEIEAARRIVGRWSVFKQLIHQGALEWNTSGNLRELANTAKTAINDYRENFKQRWRIGGEQEQRLFSVVADLEIQGHLAELEKLTADDIIRAYSNHYESIEEVTGEPHKPALDSWRQSFNEVIEAWKDIGLFNGTPADDEWAESVRQKMFEELESTAVGRGTLFTSKDPYTVSLEQAFTRILADALEKSAGKLPLAHMIMDPAGQKPFPFAWRGVGVSETGPQKLAQQLESLRDRIETGEEPSSDSHWLGAINNWVGPYGDEDVRESFWEDVDIIQQGGFEQKTIDRFKSIDKVLRRFADQGGLEIEFTVAPAESFDYVGPIDPQDRTREPLPSPLTSFANAGFRDAGDAEQDLIRWKSAQPGDDITKGFVPRGSLRLVAVSPEQENPEVIIGELSLGWDLVRYAIEVYEELTSDQREALQVEFYTRRAVPVFFGNDEQQDSHFIWLQVELYPSDDARSEAIEWPDPGDWPQGE